MPYDAPLLESDIEAFKKAGCIIEPTLSLLYYLCWKMKGNPYTDHPNMDTLTELRNQTYSALAEEYLIPELRPSFIQGIKKANQGKMRILGFMDLSPIFKYFSGVIAHGVDNVRKLFEQGACIACGNDAGGIPGCSEAMVQQELGLCECFLNQDSEGKRVGGGDALRMATITSAKALGLENQFGSITTGKTADFVIVDGDPFEDVRVVGSRVAALFKDGRLVINNCGLQIKADTSRRS
jgi:imidazolonepropionase-like amidohydrolase